MAWSHTGQHHGGFKKGHTPWNKGKNYHLRSNAAHGTSNSGGHRSTTSASSTQQKVPVTVYHYKRVGFYRSRAVRIITPGIKMESPKTPK